MSILVGVGVGEGEDSYNVGVSACKEALSKLQEKKPDVLIVFASVKYDQEKVLEGIRSLAPEALMVGSSTAGEITTEGALNRRSVVVMAIHSTNIKFFTGIGEHIEKGPREAGKTMASSITSKTGGEILKSFIMFPDVLAGNGAETVRGVLDVLGEHFPLIGGASGDDFQFKKTYQYLNGKVYSGSVVGLGLSGDFTFGIGVKHGWIPIGSSFKVTKSEGCVLHELDGKPAISIYEDYFGEDEAESLKKETLAKLAITYPLGMNVSGSEEMLIRDPLSVDKNGSITCAAEIPEGSDIRLMVGSREDAIKVAKVAAEKALADLEGLKPRAIIIFNCIARNKLFGERVSDEIQAIQSVLGNDVPLIGFYTYGEQAPLAGETKNIEKCNPAFHNETVVIGVIGEK